jgi:hypothetical protein
VRFAIFGDIGGHYVPLKTALEKLEVDCDKFILPPDLAVIQVGDLIDRGPDSDSVLKLVDGFLNQDDSRWIQLWGNHEGRVIGGPDFTEYYCREYPTSDYMRKTLYNWRIKNKAQVAAGIDSEEYGPLLITHAGLSSWWYEKFCKNLSVRSTVVTLNNMPFKLVSSAGSMLGGSAYWGGPLWAECRSEVYLSWEVGKVKPKFGQIHGHSSPYAFSKNKWRGDKPKNCSVNEKSRKTFCQIKDKWFIGIDPALGDYDPYFPVEPLLLTGKLFGP